MGWGDVNEIDAISSAFLDQYASGDADRVSVWLGATSGQPWYVRDDHVRHYAASTMKLPLLIAAYRRHERGEIDLDAPVPVRNEFRSAADGSSFSLSQDQDQDDDTWALVGSAAPLRDLVRHAIVKSGNLATNIALEHVGTAEVAAVLAASGCSSDTVLPRGIEDAVARRAGMDNLVTARDLAVVMAGVADRRLGPPPMCADVESVLAQQEHRDKVAAGLPAGTYVANKTGWVEGVAHDVALVRPVDSDPFVLVVCTTVAVPDEVASALIADVGRAAWEANAR